jgi:hypothetical protein
LRSLLLFFVLLTISACGGTQSATTGTSAGAATGATTGSAAGTTAGAAATNGAAGNAGAAATNGAGGTTAAGPAGATAGGTAGTTAGGAAGTTGTASTTGAAGTTGGTTSSSPFCAAPSGTVDNQGIGSPCTPNDTHLADGGTLPTQGSCTNASAKCFQIFQNDQPRCWVGGCNPDDGSGCPGDSFCQAIGQTESLCFPISTDFGANCPTGEVCGVILSPNAADICICGPAYCATDNDCNTDQNGQPTGSHLKCQGGNCLCTNSATDCQAGTQCDTATGACFQSCASSADCVTADGGVTGCCVQLTSGNYCDPFGG